MICYSLFDFSLGRECPILYSGVAKHNSDVKNVKGNQDYALVPEHLKRAYKQFKIKIAEHQLKNIKVSNVSFLTFSSRSTIISSSTVIPYTTQSLVIGYHSRLIFLPANKPHTDMTPKILNTALKPNHININIRVSEERNKLINC